MGGRIWFDSVPGAGTTMWFEIPLARDADEWNEAGLPPESAGAMALLVDSCALRRGAFRERLESWGLAVEEAAGAGAARELIAGRKLRPAVALVATARNPGWKDLGGWLREHCRDSLLLALSPYTGAPESLEVQAAGYAEVIPQYVQQVKLREVLARAFRREDPSPGPPPKGAMLHAKCSFACRILLTDDNAGDQTLAASLIEGMGCQLDIASSGQEAVNRVQQGPYDVVFLNLNMPQTEGFEAARQIRLLHGPARLSIVGLAADPTEEMRTRARQAGFTTIVPKPLEEKTFRASCRWANAEALEPAYDHQAALQHCGGDEQMLAKLADQFRGGAAGVIAELRAAVGQHDDGRVGAIIRQVQSTAALFSAPLLAAAGDEIAMAAERLDWAALPAAIVAIRVQLLRLLAQLPALENPA